MTNVESHLNGKGFEDSAAIKEAPASSPQDEAPAQSHPVDPALAQKLGELRQRLHATMAQVVMAMMTTPRYKHCSLVDLEHLVIDPLRRDRIAVATAASKAAAAPGLNEGQVVGVAIWAKVSPEVDAKIREQIKAAVFPIRLKPEDWASGDIVWLLDRAAAPERS